MALLAVLLPLLMLGVVLALGRYEDLLLPPREAEPLEPVTPPTPTVRHQASG
ncbi:MULTISPECIES: hypothetical protein [unclassified Streptomyces]|uniref:hypothetical protein n=1 Tax=unclassified Streptomyces TaxID=2593676 RepID=UPI0033240570|nr:hypothetical protein OG254_40910 [Streptomyces sp. NBC_01092]